MGNNMDIHQQIRTVLIVNLLATWQMAMLKMIKSSQQRITFVKDTRRQKKKIVS